MGDVNEKSIKILLLSFIIMIVTIGCSKQNTFLKAMKSMEKYNHSEFSVSLGDIELSKDGKEDVSINSMITLIKDVKIKGAALKDEKNEMNSKIDMKINVLGMEIPFEFVQYENKMYMSANYMSSIEKIVSSAFGMPTDDENIYEELENKYIESSEILKQEGLDLAKNSEEIQKKFTDYIKKMDKNKFSSKGKVITAKFDKDDFVNIVKEMKDELIKIYPDMKEMDFDELDKIDDSLIMNLDMSIDTSGKTIDYILKIGTDDEDESLKTITIKANMKFSNSDEKFKAPKKEDIITEEEFQEIIGEDTGLVEEEYEYEPETITDEEFQGFLESFKDEMEEYGMTNEELIEGYSEIYSFTEEQIKALEAIE